MADLITQLSFALIVLQLLDGYTTYFGITYKNAKEGNVIMKKLMDVFGLIGTLIITKGAFAAAIFYFNDQLDVYTLGILIAVYSIVVLNNIRIIRK